MAESDETRFRLEVVNLAQELAVEALGKGLTRGEGIYSCFMDYLQKKIEDRDASERVFAKAAWAEQTRFIKELHQTASPRPSSPRPSHASSTRSSSRSSLIPNGQKKDVNLVERGEGEQVPEGVFNTAYSDDEDFSDSSTTISFDSQHGALASPLHTYLPLEQRGSSVSMTIDETQSHKQSPKLGKRQGSQDLGDDDSGLGTSDGHAVKDDLDRVHASSKRPPSGFVNVKEAHHDPSKKVAVSSKNPSIDCKEEDLCTFAFFRHTLEDNSQKKRTEIINEIDCSRRNSVFSLTTDSEASFTPDPENDLHVMTLEGHKAIVTQCKIFGPLVLTSSRDGTLKIWSVKSGMLYRTLNCKRPIHDFEMLKRTKDCIYLVIGCEDGAIVLMRVIVEGTDSHIEIKVTLGGEYSGHLPNPIRAMALSPNGHRLATGCCFLMNQIKLNRTPQLVRECRGTLKTWDLDEMITASEESKFYDGAPLELRTMRQLVAGSSRNHTNRYDKFTIGGKGAKDEKITHGIRAIEYTPDGSMLVVGFGQPDDLGEKDRQMLVVVNAETLTTLWMENDELRQINDIHFLPTRPDEVFKMVISTQSSTILACLHPGDSNNVKVEYQWNMPVSEYLFRCSVSPNLTVGCYKYSLRFRNIHNGEEVHRIHKAHDTPTSCVCFSPDGGTVCSGARDGIVNIWNTPQLPKLHLLAKKRTSAPSASGARIVSR